MVIKKISICEKLYSIPRNKIPLEKKIIQKPKLKAQNCFHCEKEKLEMYLITRGDRVYCHSCFFQLLWTLKW